MDEWKVVGHDNGRFWSIAAGREYMFSRLDYRPHSQNWLNGACITGQPTEYFFNKLTEPHEDCGPLTVLQNPWTAFLLADSLNGLIYRWWCTIIATQERIMLRSFRSFLQRVEYKDIVFDRMNNDKNLTFADAVRSEFGLVAPDERP